jgi:hypothetical protein
MGRSLDCTVGDGSGRLANSSSTVRGVSTVLALLAREAGLLAVLVAAGWGPAAWLPRDFVPFARAAMAPALGLALCACVLVTASWLMPMQVAAFLLLLPLALASAAVGAVRTRRDRWPLGRIEALSLAAVVVVVLAAFNTPLVAQHSLGPIGYQVYDAPNYVALIDGLADHSLRQDIWGPAWDFTARIGEVFGVQGIQQIGFDSVAAAANSLLGLHASTTQSAFTIVLLLVGALGAAATVAGFAPTAPSLVWVLGGLLYAGPLTFQLFLDGSEAATAGLSLVGPLGLLGARLVGGSGGWASTWILALLLAGLYTLYPLFFPPFVITAGIAMVIVAVPRGIDAFRSRRLSPSAVGPVLPLVALGAAAVLLSPFAFVRDVRYWWRTATSDAAFAGLPQFDLPFPVLPSYVLQTREFYYLPHLSDVDMQQWFLGDIAPLLIVALICLGVWRFRPAAIVAGGVIVAAVLAYYSSSRADCSYCVQRSLLPIGPACAILMALGVAAVAKSQGVRDQLAAAVVGVVVLGLVAHAGSVVLRRGVHGAYMFPRTAQAVADDLQGRKGAVFLEGFGASLAAPAEFQAAYHAANEASSGQLAFPTETDDYVGLAYLGGVRPPTSKEYTPEYRWVYTRLADISTDRRLVEREGPYAIEERRGPLDVAIISGVAVNAAGKDRRGRAYVQGPMTFWVSATTRQPAWLRLEFGALPRPRITKPKNARVLRNGGAQVVCVPVSTTAPLRRVTVALAKVGPSLAPPPAFANRPLVNPGPYVRSMRVSTAPCARRSPRTE